MYDLIIRPDLCKIHKERRFSIFTETKIEFLTNVKYKYQFMTTRYFINFLRQSITCNIYHKYSVSFLL
jgi:hypothetical protein